MATNKNLMATTNGASSSSAATVAAAATAAVGRQSVVGILPGLPCAFGTGNEAAYLLAMSHAKDELNDPLTPSLYDLLEKYYQMRKNSHENWNPKIKFII